MRSYNDRTLDRSRLTGAKSLTESQAVASQKVCTGGKESQLLRAVSIDHRLTYNKPQVFHREQWLLLCCGSHEVVWQKSDAVGRAGLGFLACLSNSCSSKLLLVRGHKALRLALGSL